MTAAVGFPTLRLQRRRMGDYDLGTLPPGQWKELTSEERRQLTLHNPNSVNH